MKLNETEIARLPAPEKGSKLHYFAGAKIQGGNPPKGFAVKVASNGTKTFVLRYSLGGDKQMTIGKVGDWSPLNAVKRARELRQEIDNGNDPLQARAKAQARASGADLVEAICEEWFQREGKNLRTGEERRATLARLVHPEAKGGRLTLRGKAIEDVSRTDIVRLLDRIEDENGGPMADHVLAYLRKVMNWHASRPDAFRSPIVRGMARTKPKERERKRVLSDEELAAVWKVTAKGEPFHRFVRFVLLTGARRAEASEMVWEEISRANSEHAENWTLPEIRNKTKQELVRPLSAQALATLPERTGKYVFSTDGGMTPISGFSKMRAALHKASKTKGWTLHDLRRTARTLLSRAGVPEDHAERCLGHAIPGVRGVYDKYKYVPEMLNAYERLAGLLERIVDPKHNVVLIAQH
jgi:integrase